MGAESQKYRYFAFLQKRGMEKMFISVAFNMFHRDAVRKPLEERRTSLECLFSNNPDAQEIFQKLREVEQEEQFILSEIEKRYISMNDSFRFVQVDCK